MNPFKRLPTDTILNIFKRHLRLSSLVYGNSWIALGAALLCWQSRFLLEGTEQVPFPWYELLLFGGTVFVYSAHRLIALKPFSPAHKGSRTGLLTHRKPQLERNALLGGGFAVFIFFFLPRGVQAALILPALLALFYTIPIPLLGRRLRDLPWAKPVSLAFAWAWLTAWVPLGGTRAESVWPVLLIFLERGLLLFGLCIPFDIRDARLDKEAGVYTLVQSLGHQRAIYLALASFAGSLLFALLLYAIGVYPLFAILSLTVSMALAAYLVGQVSIDTPDWYYSFWLDGMLIFQPVLLLLTSIFPG